MKKIIISIFVVFLCLTMVSAAIIPSDSWFGRIISNLKYANTDLGPFTVYGDELGCSQYPDAIYRFKAGTTIGALPANAAFIDWFRGSPDDGTYSDHPTVSRQFIREDYVDLSNTNTYWTCDSGAYWNGDCYADIYYCLTPVCYSDSGCSTGQTCYKEVISQKIPNAGVCKTSTPTHQTQVYRCQSGVKTNLGKVSYGNVNFCTNPTAVKYLLPLEGTDQCLTSEPQACKSTSTPSTPSEPSTPSSNPVCGDGTCNGNELCTTCPQDCQTCPTGTTGCSNRKTEADVDCNGQISSAERNSYINKWKNKEISRDTLGIVLEEWAIENE